MPGRLHRHGHALRRAGLVDEVSVLILPTLVGGTSPRSIFVAEDLVSMEGAVDVELIASERPREDIIWLRYAVKRDSDQRSKSH